MGVKVCLGVNWGFDAPFKVLHMTLDLLLSFKPECHLRILVPVVCGPICILVKSMCRRSVYSVL